MERQKPSEPWTNERHSHYLDAMEASFVRTMLEDRNARRSPRLDRYTPDSSDSTHDSPSRARNKYQSSSSGKSKMGAKDDKRWRRRATNSSDDSYSSSFAFDQVVPQMSYKGDKGGKD